MTKTKIVAEIGINHNGDLDICKRLISIAAAAQCDYVKLQKRTPDVCVPAHVRNEKRKTPWGYISYLEYRHKLEFTSSEYEEIDEYCYKLGIKWFASVWDEESVDFLTNFDLDLIKVPSPMLTDLHLCQVIRELYPASHSKKIIMSTGMSTETEIQLAHSYLKPDIIFHTNSVYPCPCNELNLNYIRWLKQLYPQLEIGYSGHEYGLVTTFAAVAMGAEWIERHITLDRNMWGSDQASSIEPSGLFKLVKGIRDIESARGKFGPRFRSESEEIKWRQLRS